MVSAVRVEAVPMALMQRRSALMVRPVGRAESAEPVASAVMAARVGRSARARPVPTVTAAMVVRVARRAPVVTAARVRPEMPAHRVVERAVRVATPV